MAQNFALSSYPNVYLRPKGLASVHRRHPWIFSGAIARMDACKDGDIVRICDIKQNFLAIGYYQNATIAVRILSFDERQIDAAYWTEQVKVAQQLRKKIGLPSTGTNAYRLIHGEGDHVPGLIIDIYDKTAVIQCHAIGIHKCLQDIIHAIIEVFGQGIQTIYNKSRQTLPKEYAQHQSDGFLFGDQKMALCTENEHSFEIDLENSQKTGFFLDQRDNRALLASYAANMRVLNLFCYTGGFSIYALKAEASHVTSIDISTKAMEQLNRNLKLNYLEDRHDALTLDVLEYLSHIPDNQYDIIIVDPPAFAKSQLKKHNAIQAYKRLNIAAINKVKKGGLIFTFSCSQIIDQALFYNTISSAAMDTTRQARVLHIISQGADHPINIFHPEGKYLKGLVLQVL